MTKKKDIELMLPYDESRMNLEADRAKAMFYKFVHEGFSYDDLSNNPDYPVYASAELLAIILPQIIDEMIVREDTSNFLIYHILSACDPNEEERDSEYNERFHKMERLIDKETIDKICKLLTIIKNDPPDSLERIDRIHAYWKKKLEHIST